MGKKKRWKSHQHEEEINVVADYEARFDGGCNPNPCGYASCACVIYKNGKEVFRNSKYLGVGNGQTCNVSEFSGLKMIFDWFVNHDPNARVLVISDSQIVIRRMKTKSLPTGFFKKNAEECLDLLQCLPNFFFKWQRREHNSECDAMCTLEIEDAINESQMETFHEKVHFKEDFSDLYYRHANWSRKTFGPDSERGAIGPLNHLEKEIKEVQEAPGDIYEYVDCLLLVMDASRRAGFDQKQLIHAAYQKLEENKNRSWPDWKTSSLDNPMEHIR